MAEEQPPTCPSLSLLLPSSFHITSPVYYLSFFPLMAWVMFENVFEKNLLDEFIASIYIYILVEPHVPSHLFI